jgi:hypothetical protein
MSALTRFFFTPVRESRSSWAIINWWESRRLTYNLAVGSAGLLSLGVATGLALLPPHPMHHLFPWRAVLVYGVLANVFYTLGPITDAFIRRKWGAAYDVVGPVMLRYGFVFAVGLSLVPIPLSVIGWLLRLLDFTG